VPGNEQRSVRPPEVLWRLVPLDQFPLSALLGLLFDGRDPPSRERPARGALWDGPLSQGPSKEKLNPRPKADKRGDGHAPPR
jgi:hypothetical protein